MMLSSVLQRAFLDLQVWVNAAPWAPQDALGWASMLGLSSQKRGPWEGKDHAASPSSTHNPTHTHSPTHDWP